MGYYKYRKIWVKKMVKLKNDWDNFFENECKKDYFKELFQFLKYEYENEIIYPLKDDLFNAFLLTEYNSVKAVIIGQDPYHGENQAHGLAFSVLKGEKIPPSLKNIYKELNRDLGIEIPSHGNLINWAKQGVLLMNAVLTVRAGQANSHKGKGWEIFTDNVIKYLNSREKPIVFLLWGADAQKKEKFITNKNHLVLKSVHPSPLSASRGFLGCGHFSKVVDFLQKNDMKIDFKLD